MHPQTLSALILLNDLRHAAMDALKQEHKLPSLLLLYSFIDICAFYQKKLRQSQTENGSSRF